MPTQLQSCVNVQLEELETHQSGGEESRCFLKMDSEHEIVKLILLQNCAEKS